MRLAQARVHFIGIGGIGMCGLAELLQNMGATVTGSDLAENQQTKRLQELGVVVFKGQSADNVGEVDVCVYSSAIKPSNVEFAEARERRIPLIARAEALAELMLLKRGIAIAGTHGKTTTTSLVANVLLECDLDPTIVVGGRLEQIQSTAQLGQGEWLVAEADESDGSFSRLSPETVVITNIDNDHLDYYKTIENLERAFYDFAQRIPFYGCVIACGDDPVIRKMFSDFPKKVLFYGFNEDNDYVLRTFEARYQVVVAGEMITDLTPPMPGRHNALNTLAAIVCGEQAGLSVEKSIRAVEKFRGVDRRFQFKGRRGDIDFYDDYGHHPTEVAAVTQGFKEKFPDRRFVVLFQPHRYSRTQSCWDDFKTCFGDVDHLFFLDIYPAGETAIEGVDARSLLAEVDHPSRHFIEHKDLAVESLVSFLKPGDVFLSLGAGDVWRIGEATLKGSVS